MALAKDGWPDMGQLVKIPVQGQRRYMETGRAERAGWRDQG